MNDVKVLGRVCESPFVKDMNRVAALFSELHEIAATNGFTQVSYLEDAEDILQSDLAELEDVGAKPVPKIVCVR